MDVCIRSRLTSSLAVAGVGVLVMAPLATGQTAQPPTPVARPPVMLTAATQPLSAPRLLTQPTTLAPAQQLVAPQPQNPLAEQVGFHIAFVGDFLSTGAVLFAREFAIPGALLDDIHNGTAAPVAVSRALQTFAQIELEAGRELVGFAAEYVSFQLNFFAKLATMPVAAVSVFATSFGAGLAPAVSPAVKLTTTPRSMKVVPSTNEALVTESVRDARISPTTRASTESPKKKSNTRVTPDDSVSAAKTIAKGEATSTATIDTDDPSVPVRDRTPHTVRVSAGAQPHKADATRKDGDK